MKRATEKLNWTPISVEELSPVLKRKTEAWLKADSALRDAKKEMTDAFNAAGAKNKLINSKQTYRFAIGFGGPSIAVADIAEKSAAKAPIAKFKL